jgi:DNA-directed RNA polymerase subunit RPC12/RpoP
LPKKERLFRIREDVKCLDCGSKGAVQFYGDYFPNGVGDDVANKFPLYEEYRHSPYMSPVFGFGGIIPYHCLNCGAAGLIDIDGLEGYSKKFKTL